MRPPRIPMEPSQQQQPPPPPSSIALILNNNLSKTGNGHPQLADRDVFHVLLAELLTPDGREPSSSADYEEQHVSVNYKLVQVVVSAGLSTLLQDDPFTSTEDLIEQATASLLVLRLTMRRDPQVLFWSPPPEEMGSQADQPLLYLWLLPRLLPLLGHRKTEPLRKEVLDTAVAIFVAVAKKPDAWKYLKILVAYFRSCVNCCTVDSFQTTAVITAALNKSFKLELPGEYFATDQTMLRYHPTLAAQNLGFTIRDPEQAALITIRCFSIFSGLFTSTSSRPVLQSVNENFVWMLQGLSKIWASLNTWEAIPILFDTANAIRLRLLEALERALENITSSEYRSMKCQNLCMFTIRCTSDMLRQHVEKINKPAENALTGILIELLYITPNMPTVWGVLKELIYPLTLTLMLDNGNYGELSHDLQIAILRFIASTTENTAALEKSKTILQSITEGEWTLDDPNLQQKLDKLKPIESQETSFSGHNGDGPRKRLRLTVSPNHNTDINVQHLTSEVCRLLGNQQTNSLEDLSLVASANFDNLPEPERCTALKSLGLLSCALSDSLERDLDAIDTEAWGPYQCSFCDADNQRLLSGSRKYTINTEILKTLEVLLRLDSCQRPMDVRIWAMLALRRLLNHTQDLVTLVLAKSALGKWCLDTLHSSHRELRIAAGRTLPSFVNFDHDEQVLRTNQIIILDYLRKLSDGGDLSLQETCVLAWSQIGRVSSDQELNLVLIRLVEYLGHSNSIIIGVAYSELQSLAKIHGETPRRLFLPFWRFISVSVVKQLQSKPQIAQILSEILEIDVSDFLKLTQSYTMPYLILWKKSEVLEKIAQAIGPKATVFSACCANMPSILALLLAQDVENVQKSTMALLQAADPRFENESLEDLIRSNAMSIAAELFRVAGDEDEEKKARLLNPLKLVASLSYNGPEPPKNKSKEKKVNRFGVFFEEHVLGIFAEFNEPLTDTRTNFPTLEKIRSLKALEEMLKMAKGYVSSALPQIFACLQSVLETKELRTSALCAWATLMSTLPPDDIGPLLGQLLSVLLQYWDGFDNKAKNKGMEMVSELFTNHPEQIEKYIGTIPSLESVELLSKFESRLSKWRGGEDIGVRERFRLLAKRCSQDNVAVVQQALVELSRFITDNQDFIHTAAISEQPDPVVPELIRCLLDVIITFKDSKSGCKSRVERLCAECLGLVGAVDPNRVEAPREKRDMIVLHNFENEEESMNFVVFFLEERVVKAFLSATDTKSQGFLAYGMQELLRFCRLNSEVVYRSNAGRGASLAAHRVRSGQQRWSSFSQTAQNTMVPYLTSRYILQAGNILPPATYPVFSTIDKKTGLAKYSHRTWLQTVLLDLLSKPGGNNATAIFSICSKIVKGQDISISTFLLPFATLSVVVSGTDLDRKNIAIELQAVLRHTEDSKPHMDKETLMQCSETVFLVIDYLTRWHRDKKKYNSLVRAQQVRQQNRHMTLEDEDSDDIAMRRVEALLSAIPADLMGMRSFECNSYARALIYWEQHIRQTRERVSEVTMEPLYETLQRIYTQIDEPDGIEGISTKLHILNSDQQVLEHRKAGRWTAAQGWYEQMLSEKPNDIEVQTNLLTCLKESGQHETILNQVDGIMTGSPDSHSRILGFAVEASWVAGKWDSLDKYLAMSNKQTESTYEIRIGRALSALRGQDDTETFLKVIASAREDVVNGLTESLTGSLRQCHDSMVKLHSLSELEGISTILQQDYDRKELSLKLERRLDVMGTYLKDRQYILALRRAVFQLSGVETVNDNIAEAWLTSARLARKASQIHQSFNAVLHASKFGAQLATVEHAKLLWHEGHHRKAIQNLEGAIASNLLSAPTDFSIHESDTTANGKQQPQSYVIAKATLLLARWLDGAGQTHSVEIIAKYSKASNAHIRWEQGHYYLGRHYNKLYEAEKSLPPSKQTQHFLNGDTAKLICQCYLRALAFGTKYIFQTMPRLLTLWLDLGELVNQPVDAKHGNEVFRIHVQKERSKTLLSLHASVQKYSDRLPPWMFFVAFPQIMSRIAHPHETVYQHLQTIIVKVISAYPRQALWSLMAVCKSTSKDRSTRGNRIVSQIKHSLRDSKRNGQNDIRMMINQSQRLTEQLLDLCNAELPGKGSVVSLSKDLGFNHLVAPCPLVVPLQSVLTATLPSTPDSIKLHVPFPQHQPTIAAFLDDADVMTSLQRPRKIKIRGSDGRLYSFLCKPKDDLRKDARLMEFNNMINRFLKKDADSSRRRLYIRTYFVTPINEECGLIEWVNNVRPLRDILLKSYRAKGVQINYGEIRIMLDDACSAPSKTSIFTKVILPKFPCVFHEWFVETFSDPAAWFASRLAFARTCAVMSMVGHVLGLGDRHGENILFDETSGDTLHVDFNCLFDKGQSFDKPERVPFRLTNNMVDALGVTGYEGVFRRTCEVTMRVLRNNEDTLMTVLETFLHDPAVDMVKKVGGGKKANNKVPDTPKAVLEAIRNKLQGLFQGETVPLSVEGQVQELIRTAVSPENLCAMYIGWCAFL